MQLYRLICNLLFQNIALCSLSNQILIIYSFESLLKFVCEAFQKASSWSLSYDLIVSSVFFIHFWNSWFICVSSPLDYMCFKKECYNHQCIPGTQDLPGIACSGISVNRLLLNMYSNKFCIHIIFNIISLCDL